nr:serine hydrolase domain-containing protein [Streptomyces sp. SID4951]
MILRIHPAGQHPIQAHIGTASLELSAPLGETTAFNVGSVAKQITAYLCVHAARNRLLHLDRPVGDILPRFRIPGVTVGDLIQHRGGVRDAESLLSLAGFRDLDHYTADDLLQLAYRQHHRAVEPGSFLYSNTGYLLLGEVLKHVHGAAGLQDVADREVFVPLGMSSARFKSNPREVIPGAASAYRLSAEGWLHQQAPVTLPGPGSLWCTAADLDRWLDHLWHKWQAPSGIALPFEQHISYVPSDHHPLTYGAGLYADTRPKRTVVFHYGHEQGFSSAAHLTSSGLRVICLSNHTGIAADHVAATALTDLGHCPEADPGEVLHRSLQQRPKPPPTPVNRPNLDAAHIPLGAYACKDVPGTVRLTRSEGSLHLWRRGTPDHLTRTGPATYTAHGYTLTLTTSPADKSTSLPDGFVLDLDRAPGLHYRRQPE